MVAGGGSVVCRGPARGSRRARALAQRRRERLDAIYCSDLQRSRRTAEIAFGGGAIPVVPDPRLREVDYGTLTRRPRAEVDAVRADHVEEPFPLGESYRRAAERLRSLLDDAAARYSGGRILLVGHAATRVALRHLANGVPLADALSAPYEWHPGLTYTYDR